MAEIKTMDEFDDFCEKRGHKNIGYRHGRMKFPCESTNREKMFSMAWKKENKKCPGIDYGFGILQNHFFHSETLHGWPRTLLHPITKTERVIVATIIQWLGTNVGWSWLTETLKSGGYKIVKIEKKNENKREKPNQK